ncbi:MAG: GIY-YIG nuclease family protein [Acidobacteria bacterium]|nr:GIY-YIG nuclease family protein [Acidobacteriota bacterium]
MAVFWVYILQSQTSGRFYCGQTDDLVRRLREHNDPHYQGSKTTKRFKGPWIVVWNRTCSTRAKAMELETHIKKRGIKRFLSGVGDGC